ncbi:MAG: phosphatidate cytidylyltransferase [Spirochaetaceae bacterium]|jgi:phosphatidate cytidylyltransferase|nr:phosphatidate cytidylyltransferase [Spirochaetaceae bacterium]
MTKLVQRLVLFFVGIPLIMAIVGIPHYSHLVLHIAIILCTVASSREMYRLLGNTVPMQSAPAVMGATIILPVMGLVCTIWGFAFEYITYMLIVVILFLVVLEVFFPEGKTEANFFKKSNPRLSASLFTVIYAGYIITFLSRMTVWENSTVHISVFLLMVFLCDSLAWFFGHLFGKGNRGLFSASRNKSVAGFTGGICASIGVGLLVRRLFPQVFGGHWVKAVCLGLCTALASILGDLAESVFKRSAGVKDSGRVIPGRGGMLDSLDSILMAAPVYYIAAKLLYIL